MVDLFRYRLAFGNFEANIREMAKKAFCFNMEGLARVKWLQWNGLYQMQTSKRDSMQNGFNK